MTDTPKPFTADEIGATKQVATWSAEMWPFAPPEIHQIIPRLIATIEQQADQIGRLRGALQSIREKLLNKDIQTIAWEALASTEPVNDKR